MSYGINQHESRSRLTPGLIAIAMAFGAVAAIPAVFLEMTGTVGFIVVGVQEIDLLTILAVVVLAPVVEETVKPLGLYLARYELRNNLRLIDWALLGLMAGLGFKILEDLLYIFVYFNAEYGTEGMLAGALMRTHFPTHLLATSITGFGIGIWHQSRRVWPFVLSLLIAITIHAVFNLSMTI